MVLSYCLVWSWKSTFERRCVSFGPASKSNGNTGKMILYDHCLQIRQCFANEGLARFWADWPIEIPKRVFLSRKYLIFNILQAPGGGGEKCVLFWNVVCFCIGYTVLLKSSRRRSKLLLTFQASGFEEQTKFLSVTIFLGLQSYCICYNLTALGGYNTQSTGKATRDWGGQGYWQVLTPIMDNAPDILSKIKKLCQVHTTCQSNADSDGTRPVSRARTYRHVWTAGGTCPSGLLSKPWYSTDKYTTVT